MAQGAFVRAAEALRAAEQADATPSGRSDGEVVANFLELADLPNYPEVRAVRPTARAERRAARAQS